jgi:hypothetical protein
MNEMQVSQIERAIHIAAQKCGLMVNISTRLVEGRNWLIEAKGDQSMSVLYRDQGNGWCGILNVRGGEALRSAFLTVARFLPPQDDSDDGTWQSLHYDNFDAYVAAHPDGEAYRAWVTNHGHSGPVYLLFGTGPHSSLPGGYLWASIVKRGEQTCVMVHDCDDGCVARDVSSDSAQQALQELVQIVPFNMADLVEHFGYRWET